MQPRGGAARQRFCTGIRPAPALQPKFPRRDRAPRRIRTRQLHHQPQQCEQCGIRIPEDRSRRRLAGVGSPATPRAPAQPASSSSYKSSRSNSSKQRLSDAHSTRSRLARTSARMSSRSCVRLGPLQSACSLKAIKPVRPITRTSRPRIERGSACDSNPAPSAGAREAHPRASAHVNSSRHPRFGASTPRTSLINDRAAAEPPRHPISRSTPSVARTTRCAASASPPISARHRLNRQHDQQLFELATEIEHCLTLLRRHRSRWCTRHRSRNDSSPTCASAGMLVWP